VKRAAVLMLPALVVATLSLTSLGDEVRINEFLASNHGGIRDEDGATSDWIELYNAGTSAVDLGGWFLTDKAKNLIKWRSPSFLLQPNAYFVLFASGKDRTNTGAPLHTNFKLASEGGYLGLVRPDGATVASAFNFPTQYVNVSYGCDPAIPGRVGYCEYSTPMALNAPTEPGFGPAVEFSVPSGTFQKAFAVSLATIESNAIIHYFVVTNYIAAALTNLPDVTCPVYSNPIPVQGSVEIRARAFSQQADRFPGPVRSETYLAITPGMAGFKSDLPLVLFYNYGAGDVPVAVDQFASMLVFEPTNGVSSVTNPPTLATRAVYHRHGSSTLMDAKPNLRLETQDEYGGNNNQPLAGLPSDNDWIFYGTDVYDKSALHNPLAHELFREMGHYTSGTRYAEVFIRVVPSLAPGPMGLPDYGGLYVIEENIKVGKDRVAINELQASDTNAPDITGGYLLSIDRQKTDSSGRPIPQLNTAGVSIDYLDPDYFTISSPTQAVQQQYLTSYLDAFYNALYSSQWRNPTNGYAPFIDLGSWLDYHLHQVLIFNVDMLRLSAYFYKPRSAPLVQGPLWDFDRSFGTGAYGDYRGFSPWVWRSREMDGGTDPFNAGNTFNNPWYARLFLDPDFFQNWIDRYQALRGNVYSLSNLTFQIDLLANQLDQAAARDAARWTGAGQSDTSPRSGPVTGDGYTYVFPGPGTYKGEVDFAKLWFTNRVHFMDTNFLAPPTFSQNGGGVPFGFGLTISASTVEPNTQVYYTLDGTDPRSPGGGVSASAFSAVGKASIVFTNSMQVVARNWNAAHHNLTGSGNPPLSSSWSGPTSAQFDILPVFQSIVALPNGQLRFQLHFQPGSICFLDVSTNLSTWVTLTNCSAPSGVLEFTAGPTSSGGPQFYRAHQ